MDNLAKDAFMARKSGMTYGKYMANKKPSKVVKPHVEAGEAKLYCTRCGKGFNRYDKIKQKYCSAACRNIVKSEQAKERYRRYKSKKAAAE